MLMKSQTKLNRFSRADKLDCDFAPCLNYGTCTSYPFSSLGFLCICPSGYYGDFCQHRAIEWFTAVSLIGIVVILVLIVALCFAIFCLCRRERKHHRVFKQRRSSDVCLKPLPIACALKTPCCSCPGTEGYQEKYEERDCKHQVEHENVDHHLCASRNDHSKCNPEFTEKEKIPNMIEQCESICSSNAINRSPSTDIRQNSSMEMPGTISKNDGHSLMDKDSLLCQFSFSDVTSKSPIQSKQCMTEVSKNDTCEFSQQVGSCQSRNTLQKPAGSVSSLVDNVPSQSNCPDNKLSSPIGSCHGISTLSKDRSVCSLTNKDPTPCHPDYPDEKSNQQNLTTLSEQCRGTNSGMASNNAACQSDVTACELICPEISISDTFEDSEDSTSTTESCEEMLVDKRDAECQSTFQASRVPSEDCKFISLAPCPNKVEEAVSNFPMVQSKIQPRFIPCDDLSDSTSSSQSSYQEYLSSLPTDISTPRSESSSQISLSSEMIDDFVNNSECSVNSSMPSEALINLMQSYFATGDDVKSVKISILLDKSQADNSSCSSNVEENTNGSSYQKDSPIDSEQYSKIGLRNKCGFLHGGNDSTDVERSLASVENSARNSSSLDSQKAVHFDLQIPSMVGGSSDWYCADDKEPCSKTTTVRYVFTDSETDV
ncbi:uncharacterized protein LOC119964595 isoform X2 [Scyliorhinus canicula]|uniref:uncharacterized protein LOC119964595 isoform X2 n=1 Tax=Scyliorhinus canicula TaxID=7830 RepID=UPI0018F5F7C5|nr:uncharacterized protein LOC119964595 isoform X2 [Scyliorhinus canicula]